MFIFIEACVSPGGVKRVEKRLVHQQKEEVFSTLIEQILKKQSSKLQFLSIDYENVSTIHLINNDFSGIENWGKEIVAIQNCLKQ